MSDTVYQLERQFLSAEQTEEQVLLLYETGVNLFQSNPSAALEQVEQAYALAESIDSREQMARAMLWIGRCRIACSDYSGALSALASARELLDELPDCPDIDKYRIKARSFLGMVYDRLGQRELALALFRESLEAARASGQAHLTASALNSIGNMMLASSRCDKAIEAYSQALVIWNEKEHPHEVALVVNNIAHVYAKIGDTKQSIAYFLRGIDLAKRTNARVEEAYGWLGLNEAYKDCNQYEQALDCLYEAEKLFTAFGDKDGVAHVLVSIGGIHLSLSKPDDAMIYFRQALGIAEETGDREYIGSVYYNIGICSHSKGNHHEAVEYFKKALVIAEQTLDRSLRYHIHLGLSEAYEAAGALVPALEHYKLYTAIKEEVAGAEQQRMIAELESRLALEKTESEKELYRIRSENLELETNLKAKELATTILHLVQKNEFLVRFSKKVERILKTSPSRSEQLRQLESLLHEVRRHIDARQEYPQSSRWFDMAHNDFVTVLAQRCPALSSTELKICALLQTGIPSQSIADLLCIASRTLSYHRNNIRRKLGLHSRADLIAHLHSLAMPVVRG